MALRATIDRNNLIRLVLSGLECYTGTQMKAYDKYDKDVKYWIDITMWDRQVVVQGH